MNRSIRLGAISVFALLLLSLVPCASAQNYLYGIGDQTWGINIPIENGFINVANGQVHLEITLANHAQRGSLALGEALVYDSRIWQIVASGSTYSFQPTNVPNSMAGWRFVNGLNVGSIQNTPIAVNLDCYNGNPSGNQLAYFNEWFSWTDPSGSVHSFPVQTQEPVSSFCAGTSIAGTQPNTPTGSGYAADGSGYYLSVTNYTNATVFDTNGNEVYPAIIDRNGNKFTADANGNLVDTLGRTPVIKTTSGNYIYFDVLTIGGATKRYTVQTQSISVHTAFGQSAVNEYSGTLTAIKNITLPDGSTYTFNYDSGTASGNYGELASVVLPTGGTVSLTYSNYLDSYQNQNRWLTAYSGGAGNYTFTPSVVTQCTGSTKVGCQEQVAVKDGNYNQTIYLLTLNNGAWNSQIDVYSGTTTPIMSTATAYDFTTSCNYYNCNGAQWITASSVTTTLSDTGQKAQTLYSYTYPWLAKPSVVKKWDYYTGSPASLPAKEIDYTYGMFVNGAAFPTLVQMKDATGTVISQTQYGYSSTVTSTSGLPNHGTAPGARGNVTNVTAGVGSTITTATAYDDAGTPVSKTDGNQNTTYITSMCSDSLIQTVTYPVSVSGQNLQTKSTYDCSSGLLLSAQDMNGVVSGNSTTYAYFTSGSSIGKLQKITYPDGGNAIDSYPSTTEVDQTVAQTGSVNITSKAFVDSYGRSSQQVIVAPEGSISSETTYNATGRPASVTTSHIQGATASTDGTTSTYYDVLGRKTLTLNPDGTSVSTTYSGATQTVKDELSHTRKYTYDAFHRLVSVWEPNASGTLAYETDYTYNGLDLLVQVDQWGAASGSSSPGDRQRKYAYDSLGRRIAENIPEFQSASHIASRSCSGAVAGSLWTACFAYDNNGNLTSTTDNSGRTTSDAYDALNRVTQETYSDGTLKKVFGYDGNDENGTSLASSGLTTSNARGRLSITRNQSNEGQVFSYDAMGRLTTETYYLPLKAAWNVQVSAAYDLAGNLVSITYPDGRVVAQTYDSANRLNGVKYSAWNSTSVGTSYYNASSFAPPGQVTNATLGNGTTVANTFSNRQTQKSLAYANSSGTLWSRQYSWDKNASNLSLEVDGVSGYGRQYTYDTLDRLLTAQDIPVSNSGSVKASGTITISGTEKTALINCSGGRSTCTTVYDWGAISAIVNGSTVGSGGYGAGSTSSAIASDLASSINANPYAPVTASSSSTVVTITSKIGGTGGNYSLSKSVTYDGTDFSSASFSATTSGSTLTGGAGSAPSPALNESYSYDPFGNLTQSGNFGFSYSFNSYNQMVTGFGYAANGQETADIGGHALAYDANDLLLSVAGGAETYVYDSEGNRVEVHGSTVTDYVYFGGLPIASLTGSSYTDFIYVGDALIAEVAGSQTATPTYRVFDGLETLGGFAPATGSLSSAVNYAPYGQLFSGSTSDPFGFTGLQWDTATSLWHATARQFNPQQGRWMTPDPYDGSYNWANPQSLNRYAYVNGRPMWTRDPSGQGGACSVTVVAVESGAGPYAAIPGALCAFELIGGSWLFDHMLAGLFHSTFHGSLAHRPSAGPMSETLGMPMGWHPPTGIGGILGSINGAGCEFGACGAGPSAFGQGPGGSNNYYQPMPLPSLQLPIGPIRSSVRSTPGPPRPKKYSGWDWWSRYGSQIICELSSTATGDNPELFLGGLITGSGLLVYGPTWKVKAAGVPFILATWGKAADIRSQCVSGIWGPGYH